MKNTVVLLILVFNIQLLSAQSIFGQWKTIDDETGEEKSIVEIFEVDGKVYGKILKVLNPKRKNPVCDKCEGENQGKPILGMQIIEGLEKEEEAYEGGTILNPSNGKVYKCRLKIDENPNRLQVRGYVAFFL